MPEKKEAENTLSPRMEACVIFILIVFAYGSDIVLENSPRYLRVSRVENDTYEVQAEAFNPKWKFSGKGGTDVVNKKDAIFHAGKEMPSGMYQFIPMEEGCDGMIYASKASNEASFIPDELDYTIGRSSEPEVIFLPEKATVKVKSSSCKKPIRLKKSTKLNYITKLPVEQYGLSKVPAEQKELKVDLKKKDHGKNWYEGNSMVATLDKDKLISYKLENEEYYKTEYLIKNSDYKEYSTMHESYDKYLKTHKDFSVELLDKTFVKNDYVR